MDALFYKELFEHGYRMGIRTAESSWILEDNGIMTRALDKMGFVPYKTYRLFERALAPRPGSEAS